MYGMSNVRLCLGVCVCGDEEQQGFLMADVSVTYSACHRDVWLVPAGARVNRPTPGVRVCAGLRLEVSGCEHTHVCPMRFVMEKEHSKMSLNGLWGLEGETVWCG